MEAAGLAAVVGETLGHAVSLAALQGYDAVQRLLVRQFAAVIPARFGSRIHDDAEAAFILGTREEALRAALRRVQGRAQMTLRTLCDAGVGQAPKVRAIAGQPTSSGADYLRLRAAEAAQDRDVPALEPVVAAVRSWVRAERFERRGAVASLFQLVPCSAAGAYAAAARRAAEAAHVQVLVSGPFPAYAFAP